MIVHWKEKGAWKLPEHDQKKRLQRTQTSGAPMEIEESILSQRCNMDLGPVEHVYAREAVVMAWIRLYNVKDYRVFEEQENLALELSSCLAATADTLVIEESVTDEVQNAFIGRSSASHQRNSLDLLHIEMKNQVGVKVNNVPANELFHDRVVKLECLHANLTTYNSWRVSHTGQRSRLGLDPVREMFNERAKVVQAFHILRKIRNHYVEVRNRKRVAMLQTVMEEAEDTWNIRSEERQTFSSSESSD